MINKLNASEKLYLLVFVMFIFIIGTGTFGIIEMKTMSENTQTLYADRVLPMEQLTMVRYSYLADIISSTEQTQKWHTTFKETVKHIDDAEKSISDNWHAYLLTFLTPAEAILAKQASALMNQADEKVEKLKEKLSKNDFHSLDDFINNELYPTVNPVIAKLNELIDLQVRVGGEVYKNSNEVYKSSLKKFLLLIALSLLLGVPFSYYLVRSIKNLIRDIQASNIKLAESEDRYRSLIEQAGDAIFVSADDLTINDVNTSACKLLGYTHNEFLNKKITDLFDKEELEKRPVQLLSLAKNKALLSERTLVRKDGTSVNVEFNIRLLEGNGHLSIARDITERKHAEVLLQESEDRFSKAFRSAPIAIAATHVTDGEFREVNEAMELFLGYDRSELLGNTTLEMAMWVDLEDRAYVVSELAQKGTVHGLNYRFRAKEGRIVIGNYSAELIDLKGVKCILSVLEDITEQKQTEEALRESEKKYRNIFENVQDVFFQTSLEGTILEVSPSVKHHIGLSREEMIGTSSINLYLDPADRERGLDLLRRNGEISDYEYKFKTKTGEPIYISLNARLIAGDGKGPGHINGVFKNITERKKAEEKIRQSEARLKEAQEIAHIGNWEIDMVNNIHIWSDESYKILGVTKDEIQPSTEALLSFMHPDDLGRAQEEIRQAFDTLSDSTSDFRLIRRDGSVRYAHIIWRFEFDKHKQPIRLYGILQDITERTKAEQRIKQSEANYRQLFKLSPAPMWVIDEETFRFTEVNQACLNNYGYSEEEFAGMTIMNISPKNIQADVRSAISKNQSSAFLTGSNRHIRKSGEIIEVETSSIPVVLNGKKQKLVIAMDVTEKNLYEQKLTRAAIKAQEDERYEIGGELHDNVCQILAMSLMRLGMIKKQLPDDAKESFEQTHEYISLASEEIRNLSHRLAPAFFDNATLEDEFDTLLTNFNVENKYEITLSFDNLPKNYTMERELQLNLYRILQEQLRNILKYADATRIEVEVTINNATLQMKIADNGVGFDVESIKGGIGFTNMNRRVLLFSGDLTVDSTLGHGCRIFVNIPI